MNHPSDSSCARHRALRLLSSVPALSAVVASIISACSAPPTPGDDEAEVPDYSGSPQASPAAAAPTAAAPTAAAPTPAAPTPAAPAPAASANAAAPAAAPSPAATPGASNEGSAPVAAPPAPSNPGSANASGANAGAGGSAMVGAAGAGAGPADPANVAGAGGALPAPIGEVAPQEPQPDPEPAEPQPVTPPPTPAPPPQALPGGFYFSDDFEGGRDPQWADSTQGGNGTITLDTTLGARGSSSSVRIDSNNAFHTMLQLALPQAVRDAGEVFGRVFLRLAAAPSGGHFIWVEVGTEANDGHEMRLGHNVGRLQSNHFLNGEQDIRDQNRQLGAEQFYCLEFFMGDSPDELRVWLDGVETALSTTNYTAGEGAEGNTNPVADFIPPLDALRIGWELQNGTVWFDDVALASTQIGCD